MERWQQQRRRRLRLHSTPCIALEKHILLDSLFVREEENVCVNKTLLYFFASFRCVRTNTLDFLWMMQWMHEYNMMWSWSCVHKIQVKVHCRKKKLPFSARIAVIIAWSYKQERYSWKFSKDAFKMKFCCWLLYQKVDIGWLVDAKTVLLMSMWYEKNDLMWAFVRRKWNVVERCCSIKILFWTMMRFFTFLENKCALSSDTAQSRGSMYINVVYFL